MGQRVLNRSRDARKPRRNRWDSRGPPIPAAVRSRDARKPRRNRWDSRGPPIPAAVRSRDARKPRAIAGAPSGLVVCFSLNAGGGCQQSVTPS